jgi:hypothetical protein
MPPETTVPPFLVALSAAGISAPTGAKISAASSGSGGASSEPHRAEIAGEILAGDIARLGEGEHLPALEFRDLGDDVRRCAKTVNSDSFSFSGSFDGKPQGAIADQPGAQQRSRRDIVEFGRQREAIALVGGGQLGVAAVDLIAGEAGAVAEILSPAAAIIADPAGPAEPRHPHPLADREAVDRRALLDHGADDLVSRDQWQLGMGQFAVDDMKVGAAHRAGLDRDQHLARRRFWRRQLGHCQRPSRRGQHLCPHATIPNQPRLRVAAVPA